MLKRTGRSTSVVCVAPEFLSPAAGWDDSVARQRYRRRMLTETGRVLDQAKASLAGEVKTSTEFGSPAQVIQRLSADHDVIVIGAKGTGARPQTGLGPVAGRVLDAALSPIFIGRPLRSDEGFRVLIAVDGSAASKSALEKAIELLDLASADVTLFHVTETPWLHLGLDREWLEDDDVEHDRIDPELPWQRQVRDQSGRLLLAAADRLRAEHPGVEMVTGEGTPANEILSQAEMDAADLIVMGATGLTDMKHTMLGSVSAKVAWDAPCSVLIVRR